MSKSENENPSYSWMMIKWLLGNFAFGIAPLLLVFFLKLLPLKPEYAQEARDEVHHLFNSGLIFFVCVALTGAVVVDIWNSDFKERFRNNFYFLLVVSPFLILGLVLFVYTFVVFKILDDSYFSSTSWLNIFVMAYSVLYCAFAKYRMFALEA